MSDQAVLLLRKQLKGAKTTRRDAPPFAGANRRARAGERELSSSSFFFSNETTFGLFSTTTRARANGSSWS